MDAFISRMIASGPLPKRPPQMLLESELRRLSLISVFAVCALSVGGCDRESAPKEQAEPVIAPIAAEKAKAGAGLESANGLRAELSYRFAGRPAPDVAFKGADGREVALTDFAGRPLLVNIWATYCVPCKVEMPTLDALAELEAGNITVIAVAQDLQGRKVVLPFFSKANIANLEPYIDPANRLMNAVGGAPALPTTILYDSEGREVWRVIGGVEWDDAEMSALLAEAD
jgi:thiol-disulfide isomerase/thioredoxin